MRLVIALGGNALLRRGEQPDADVQLHNLRAAAPALARLARSHQVLIVHGNGPQVGLLAEESSSDPVLARPYPLADLVAETQGLIGSWMQREISAADPTITVATLVSRVRVDPRDPAWNAPTKFVGGVMTHEQAEAMQREHGWTFGVDGAGWRRTVPSPRPIAFLDQNAADTLLNAGCTVIAGGGGGIPYVQGTPPKVVDAVVDKDLTASLIARGLLADRLIILTDVTGVFTEYGTDNEKLLRVCTPEGLRELSLPAGSMGPKVTAVAEFTHYTGRRSAIGALRDLSAVLAGTAGTQIIPTGSMATTVPA